MNELGFDQVFQHLDMAATVAAQEPVSPQLVGNAFVHQYYNVLHHSPEIVHRFYQDISKLGRPEEDGSMSITTTMEAINEKILSLNYGELRAEIKSVDALESFEGGVHVLVTGYLSGKDNPARNFSQTFFLAPQDSGYFVLNDIFRYLENANVNPELVSMVPPTTPEPSAAPPQEIHVSDQNSPSTDEASFGEVQDPHENVEVPIVREEVPEEEVPIAEVVDEAHQDSHLAVESCAQIEEVQKKTYASIVKHLKETAANFSPPPPAHRRAPPKAMEQVNPPLPPSADAPVPSSDAIDIGNNQEADGCSIYVKGLPMNATESLLEEVFKKFGAIKNDGIQVRSNRQQVFCFGFVEFEEPSAAQNAIEASAVAIGGRQCIIEEKKSTNSRGNFRGRFQSGRGSGFRNEGARGRANYGGGRGYNGRGDFTARNEFGNRGGSRGYQRTDNINGNVGRMSRAGGMVNGAGRNMAPRVSATA